MATVEASQPVSIESFSYSWLINIRPSLESISDSFRAAMDSSDESSFIDMDPKMPPSKRFNTFSKDFDFNLSYSEQSKAAIVHADELFCNGLLTPLVDLSSNARARGFGGGGGGSSSPDVSLFSDTQKRKASFDVQKLRCSSLRSCRSLLSRKMFEKYLYFLCPLLEKIRCCRLSKSKHRAAENRIWEVKNNITGTYSPQASPRTSVGDRRRSCDSESSIHEAVLHCKRSIGM